MDIKEINPAIAYATYPETVLDNDIIYQIMYQYYKKESQRGLKKKKRKKTKCCKKIQFINIIVYQKESCVVMSYSVRQK